MPPLCQGDRGKEGVAGASQQVKHPLLLAVHPPPASRAEPIGGVGSVHRGRGNGEMRRGAIAAAVAAASMLVGGGLALAHTASHPTTIVRDGEGSGGGGTTLVWGHLDSPKHRCLPGRTLKLFARNSDGSRELLD